ncbi:MAG TPA: hypothetical protein VKR53_02855, partial [Puia sp.]|nr:hypothetical protein [Puia sp.]
MHDPEFEKQVQKKLEELRFDPSGAVWAKVEQEMKKDKRRRPLLWIFLLTGMLLGTGSWFLVGSYKNYKQTNTKTAETGTKVLPENNDEKKKSADNQIVESTNDNPIHQQKTPEQEEDPKGNTGRVHALMAGHKSITKNNTTIKPQTSSLQKKSLDDKQSVPLFQGKNDEIEEKIKRKKENPDPVSPIARNIAADSMKTSKTDLGDNENTTADTQVSKEHLADQINDKKEVLVTRNNKATDSQRNKTAFVKKIISRKSTSLKMGLTAGGGFSDVSKMMSGFQSPAGTAGNNASTGPSFIQKGISFYAGAFLEKLFSKTISLSAGLNYHYYSTKIRTGKTDDSIIYVPAYNFSTASNPVPASISRPSYYASGTTNS